MKQAVLRTAKARRGRNARTHRAGKRGLTELMGAFQGVSGYSANTLGIAADTTYGEVTPSGIAQLSAKFQQLQPRADVFYDLGCGVGKVVAGMAFLHPGLQTIGYEIVPDRVRAAETALARLPEALRPRIQITLQNFLEPEFKLSGQRVWVYCSNLLLKPHHQAQLAELLETRAPATCTVLCSTDIPFREGSTFRQIGRAVPIQMSWSATSTCLVYQRLAATAATV